jgi:hypothetical protein
MGGGVDALGPGGSDCGLLLKRSLELVLFAVCGSGGNDLSGLDMLLVGLLTSMFKDPFLYSTFSRMAASASPSERASVSPTEVSGLLSSCATNLWESLMLCKFGADVTWCSTAEDSGAAKVFGRTLALQPLKAEWLLPPRLLWWRIVNSCCLADIVETPESWELRVE